LRDAVPTNESVLAFAALPPSAGTRRSRRPSAATRRNLCRGNVLAGSFCAAGTGNSLQKHQHGAARGSTAPAAQEPKAADMDGLRSINRNIVMTTEP